MNQQQITQTAELILDEYYYLKPDDFKLCFANAKKGVYGKVYDRIDGQIICEWLTTYCNQRADYFETLNSQSHKEKSNEPINYELVKKWYDEGGNDYMEKSKNNDEEYSRYKAEMFKKQIESEQNNPDHK